MKNLLIVKTIFGQRNINYNYDSLCNVVLTIYELACEIDEMMSVKVIDNACRKNIMS